MRHYECYASEALKLHNKVESMELEHLPGYVADAVVRGITAIRHLLPDLDGTAARSLVRRVCYRSMLASLDVKLAYLDRFVEDAIIEDPHSVLDGAPKIFCTFHYGAYKLVAPILVREGYSVVVLVSGDVLEKQVGQLTWQVNALATRMGWEGRGYVHNVDSPAVVRRTLRHAGQGAAILIFADGNSGSGGIRRRDGKLITVPFLGSFLKARKGVGAVAMLADLPVVPVHCNRPTLTSRHLVIARPIEPSTRDHGFEQVVADVVTAAYRHLETLVTAAPEEWEVFMYALNWLVPRTETDFGSEQGEPAVESLIRLNTDRYELATFSDGMFLIDVKYLRFVRVPDDLYPRLRELMTPALFGDLDDVLRERIRPLFPFGLLKIDALPPLYAFAGGVS